MADAAIEDSTIETFRAAWIGGHLDHQRAAEVLEEAERSCRQARDESTGRDPEDVRRAQLAVEGARRRLAEVEDALAKQFDRFCGISRRKGSAQEEVSSLCRSGGLWIERAVGLGLVCIGMTLFYGTTIPGLLGPRYVCAVLGVAAVAATFFGMPLLVTGRVRQRS